MFRILHCIHSLNPAGGGPADFVRQCASMQHKHHIELEVVCLDPPDAPWLSAFPAVVHALGPGVLSYGFCPRFLKWIRQNAGRFDVLVIDGLWQFSSFAARLGAIAAQRPYVVFTDGMLDPWFNEQYPLKALKKRIYWLFAERKVLRDAAAVFFTAEEERMRAALSFKPYQANGLVVPYGTMPPPGDTSDYRSRFAQMFPRLAGKTVFLYLSRVHPKKGCDLLLTAMKNICRDFPDAHLMVVGPSEPVYEKKLNSIGLPEGVLTRIGMVDGELKWALLSGADALVLPSHQENFARVVTESLSCSTPVLLSQRVNIWSRIVQADAGFAAPDTIEGTELMLRTFLQLSDRERLRMRELALTCFDHYFDAEKNFPKYLNLLNSRHTKGRHAEFHR